MARFKWRDIEELLELLNPESPEDEARLVKALGELFGVPADEQRERERYAGVAAVVKEFYGDEGYRRFAGGYIGMRNADFYRRREAMVRLTNAMKERQSWKHPLAGFEGGPSAVEGGPVVVVKEANLEQVRQTLEKNLVDGVTKFKIGPVIVHQSVNGDFWRLETPYPVDGFQLAVHWAGLYAYETNSIESAIEHIARAMDAEAATKERKAEHPLAQFFGSWSGSAGQTVQT